MSELDNVHNQIIKCKKCRLWKIRKHAVPGEGNPHAKIMFVGQAPGRTEDETGRPFVGRAGKLLTELLTKNGIKREDVFITSAIKCFPPANRMPKKDEIESCAPYLEMQISLIKPKIIFLLGNVSVNTVLEDAGRLGEIHGTKIMKDGTTYIPTYHPAAALRFPWIKRKLDMDFKKQLSH